LANLLSEPDILIQDLIQDEALSLGLIWCLFKKINQKCQPSAAAARPYTTKYRCIIK